MELRVHGGPALVFPSFRKVLCWEQLPGAAQQLLMPGSIALASAVALACGDQRRERAGDVPGVELTLCWEERLGSAEQL